MRGCLNPSSIRYSIMDTITQQIREMYERYPYPKRDLNYIENLLAVAKSSSEHFFSTRTAMEIVTGEKAKRGLKIFNAGCGTGENFIFQAINEPESEFVLLDVTPGSLEKVRGYVKHYNLQNVKVIEGDIMELDSYMGAEYENYFDFVICTGVLHHLPSPETGLKNIRKKMKPDGMMLLMLYGGYGRYEISLLQKSLNILEKDRTRFSERMEVLREIADYLRISKEPLRLSLSPTIKSYLSVKDYKIEEAVDAFLHVNENVYSVEGIFRFLDTADLRFLQFDDEPVWNPALRPFPALAKRMAGLSTLEKYSLLEIFDGYKKVHTFFCADRARRVEPPGINEIKDCKIFSWPRSSLIEYGKNISGYNSEYRFFTSDAGEDSYRFYKFPLTPIDREIVLCSKEGRSYASLVKAVNKRSSVEQSDFMESVRRLHDNKVIYFVRN